MTSTHLAPPRIATIATNRSDDPLCKTTLILAPVALLDQWQQEIGMKTDLDMKCLIYHGRLPFLPIGLISLWWS